jgi:hypothetical protein
MIEGIPLMYEKLFQEHKEDALYLLINHAFRSFKLKKMIKTKEKDNKVLECVKRFGEDEKYNEICKALVFTILNNQNILYVDEKS